ncbi:hypothetical protein B0J14DRAFT_704662 [Halenospora varia]|nr:hypothetical protein B0J14DRAFT_704662 [Halenospora varia]
MSSMDPTPSATQNAWSSRLRPREQDTTASDLARNESTQQVQGSATRGVGWNERKLIKKQRQKEQKAWLRENFGDQVREQQRARRDSRHQQRLEAANANRSFTGPSQKSEDTGHSQIQGPMTSGLDAPDQSHPKWQTEERDRDIRSLADIPVFEGFLLESGHEHSNREGDEGGSTRIASAGNHNKAQSTYQATTEWTARDQLALNHTSYQEIMLWRLSHYLFGVIPPELLPSGEKVDLGDNNYHTKENFNIAMNPNWSSEFCQVFAELICLPWFDSRVELVQYAIQYALYCRLGDQSGRMPPSPDILYLGRNDRFVKELSDRKIDVGPSRLEDFIFTITEVFGKDEPVDAGFLNLVPNVVQQMKDEQLPPKEHIAKRDLYAIMDAWDAYRERFKNIASLKTATEYKEDFYERHYEHMFGMYKVDKEFISNNVLARKKEWILSKR